MSKSRGFAALIGETIIAVDETAINSISVTTLSGKTFEINGDEQHYQIAVLQCFEPESISQ